MNVVSSFITHAQSPEVHQPGIRGLDEPAIDAQAAAVLFTAAGDHRFNAALAQGPANLVVKVVGSVGVKLFGAVSRHRSQSMHC